MHEISYIYQELEQDGSLTDMQRGRLNLQKDAAYNEADRIVGKLLKLS